MKDFSSEFFIANRTELRKRLKDTGPIVLSANGLVQRAGDTVFPFRQDSNFWYLTGLADIADAVLVMSEEKDYLILPERDAVMDFFDGALDKQAIADRSGIAEVHDHHEGWEQLVLLLKKHSYVYTGLYKGFDQRHGIYLNPSKSRLVSRLRKVDDKLELRDIRQTLARMRMVKYPVEIKAIQESINVTIEMFNKIFVGDWYNTYSHEQVINAQIHTEYMQHGAVPAYASIVAGGKRACTLHYIANNHQLHQDELLLVDAGAELNHYAADITRVFSPNKMTNDQQTIYSAVKEAQDYALSLLKPGVNLRSVDKKVTTYIGKFLKSQKLITKNEPSQVRKFYPHAVSHHLGLDVHDAADYELNLAEGMVITIEPGIYIPDKNIGVRIEDDILITKTGYENLSQRLPS